MQAQKTNLRVIKICRQNGIIELAFFRRDIKQVGLEDLRSSVS
jgi:hypothetical protein